MFKNAIIFTRISTGKQDKELSLPAQKSRLSEYARRLQMTVIHDPFVLIESSTIGDRAEFMAVIDYCARCAPVAFLAETIDRVQRSFEELPLLNKMRLSGQIEFHFLRENLVVNKDSPWYVVRQWLSGIMGSTDYIECFKENVARSVREKISRGEYPGRPPLGYINIRGRGDIQTDDRAPLVRHFLREFATGGMTVKSATEFAFDIGLRATAGRKLSRSHIHKMLSQPFYYGLAKWGDTTFMHKYPPLIDRATFDRNQDILSGRNQHAGARWGSIPYIYRGIVRDQRTGQMITTERHKGHNYLQVWNDDHTRRKSVSESAITAKIYEILQQITVPREVIDEVGEYLKDAKKIEIDYHQRAQTEFMNDLHSAERRYNNLMDRYLDDKVTEADYQAKGESLRLHILELKNKLSLGWQGDDRVNETIISLFDAARGASENFLSIAIMYADNFEKYWGKDTRTAKTSEPTKMAGNKGKFELSEQITKIRKMLKLIFRTLEMNDTTLCYDLNFPFNMFAETKAKNSWRTRQDSNL